MQMTHRQESQRSVAQDILHEAQHAAGRPGMRVYFAIVALAFGAMVSVGAGLNWDGAYFMFSALDAGAPFVPFNRLIHAIAQYPAIALSVVTDNSAVLSAAFSLGYALIPLAALLTSWLLVRSHNRTLFVWVALSTNLGLLTNQFSLTTEAIIAIYLAWPIALAMVIPPRPFHIPVVAIFAMLLIITHPTALVLFAIVGGMALLTGLRFRTQRAAKLVWAAVFMCLAGIMARRFAFTRSAYEAEQLSLARLQEAFSAALSGMALVIVALSLLAALLVAAQVLVTQRRTARMALAATELLLLTVAMALSVMRAAHPDLWMGALDFRSLALFVSLPFFGLLLAEGLRRAPNQRAALAWTWPHRQMTVQLAGLTSLLTLATQSYVWHTMSTRLLDEMKRSDFACISMTSVPWMERTALNHWSVTAYSLVLQGRAPRSVVLGHSTCTMSLLKDDVQIAVAPWEDADWHGGGWFAFAALYRRIRQDGQVAGACQYSFADGWYWSEAHGQSMWRWMSAAGRIFLVSDRERTLTLRANMLAAAGQNEVQILVNGAPAVTLSVSAERAQPVEQSLRLPPGPSWVTLVSAAAPITSTADTRPRTLGVENLTFTAGTVPEQCRHRP